MRPDIISMAKGMGNGFPIGGILIGPQFEASYGLLGTTFGGSHLACAAGIAVLDVLQKETLIENAASQGAALVNKLKTHLPNVEIRGEGLMIGIECSGPVKDVRKKLLFEEHLFVGSSTNKHVLRLLPPLTISEKEVDECVDKLVRCIQDMN